MLSTLGALLPYSTIIIWSFKYGSSRTKSREKCRHLCSHMQLFRITEHVWKGLKWTCTEEYLINEDRLRLHFSWWDRLLGTACLFEISHCGGTVHESARTSLYSCLNVHFQAQNNNPPVSGSAFRLVVTKLEGKSPTPLWFSPFHQFGSLDMKMTSISNLRRVLESVFKLLKVLTKSKLFMQ